MSSFAFSLGVCSPTAKRAWCGGSYGESFEDILMLMEEYFGDTLMLMEEYFDDSSMLMEEYFGDILMLMEEY